MKLIFLKPFLITAFTAIAFILSSIDLYADIIPESSDTLTATYKLHGQTRRFKYVFHNMPDGGIKLDWSIVRNLKLWTGSYVMTRQAVRHGDSLSYLMPEDGNHITLDDSETFGIISADALANLKDKGETIINGILFKKIDVSPTTNVIHARDNAEGANIWILDNPRLPLILKMTDNPIEIYWTLSFLFPSDAQNIGICQMNPTERELVK